MAILAALYQRRDELVAENACPCQACTRIEALELKMVVHRGEVLETQIAGYHALAGMPVIVAHRLLKNAVPSHRYVLVTEAATEFARGLPSWPVERHAETLGDGSTIAVTAHIVELSDLAHRPCRRPGTVGENGL